MLPTQKDGQNQKGQGRYFVDLNEITKALEKLISSLKLWAKKQGVSFSFRVTKNEKLTFCVSCYDTNYAVNLAKNLCHLIKKTI